MLEKLKKVIGSGEAEPLKKKIENRNGERCIHRHSIKTHPNCFRRGGKMLLKNKQRWYEEEDLVLASFDIETTNFKANIGFILSWAIKYHNGKTVYDVITKKDIMDGKFDKRIVKSLLDELENVDILVSYYGTGFDVPFLRTRALYWGFNFPAYGSIYHFDVYYRVRRLLKLHRNSMDAASRFFGIDGKTHVDVSMWAKAAYGHAKSLKEILDHNVEDVKITEELFKITEDYSKWTRRSL